MKKPKDGENIPKDGFFIIAANHSSYVDDIAVTIIVIKRTNKKVHMYCNDRYYNIKYLASILKWGGCIPVSVQTRNENVNKKAFQLALEYLKKGEPVGIFPEGGRSIDGRLQQAKTGIAKLTLTARVPVLPVGVIGSHKVLPKTAAFPRLKRFQLKVGKPIYFDKYYGKENDKKILKEVTTIVMKKIAQLIGQEYRY